MLVLPPEQGWELLRLLGEAVGALRGRVEDGGDGAQARAELWGTLRDAFAAKYAHNIGTSLLLMCQFVAAR